MVENVLFLKITSNSIDSGICKVMPIVPINDEVRKQDLKYSIERKLFSIDFGIGWIWAFTTATVLPKEPFQKVHLKIILEIDDDSAIQILQFGWNLTRKILATSKANSTVRQILRESKEKEKDVSYHSNSDVKLVWIYQKIAVCPPSPPYHFYV